jgi:hypothetical protein
LALGIDMDYFKTVKGKFKYIIIIFSLGFLGCPAPSYYLSFKLGNEINKRFTIQEGDSSITISGRHMLHGAGDRIYLKFEFSGIEKINKKKCLDIIHFESNRFEGGDSQTIWIKGDTCEMTYGYNRDAPYTVTFPEYISDLDTVYARVIVQNIFSKIDTVDIVFDKKWLSNRFGVNYEKYLKKKNK